MFSKCVKLNYSLKLLYAASSTDKRDKDLFFVSTKKFFVSIG